MQLHTFSGTTVIFYLEGSCKYSEKDGENILFELLILMGKIKLTLKMYIYPPIFIS